MSEKPNRWLVRNRQLRADNDYNRVMYEYISFKYTSIKEEVDAFYSGLKDKYPDQPYYKGSKRFRTWVHDEIKSYVAMEMENAENTDGVAMENFDVAETVVLAEGFANGDGETDVLSKALVEADVDMTQPSSGVGLDAEALSLDNMDKLITSMIQDLGMDLFNVENDPNNPPVDWW